MIAVLVTCFNRKEKTLRCLNSIYKQFDREQVHIYLCDDGSSDGTADAVHEIYPEVHIYKGGNLYWNRGMLLIMREAVKKNYDYYLMINDDVEFYDTMFEIMMSFEVALNSAMFAVVGSTCDQNGKITYGGRKCLEQPLTYGQLIEPNGTFQKCDMANWNCFLLSKEVVQNVGLLDEIYEHGFGDYDYCYRMKKNNIPVYVAPNYIGKCENNKKVNPLNDVSVSRKDRIRILFSNKGIPVKSWHTFTKRYGGTWWVKTFVGPYIKNCIKIILNKPVN